jgi:hypothetical protein
MPRDSHCYSARKLGVAAAVIILASSIGARAAISEGLTATNARDAELQRAAQFHQAEESYQEKLKVGRQRYDQKQVIRGKIIAGMASELQARQQTVMGQSPEGSYNDPSQSDGEAGSSWAVNALVLAVTILGFAYYLGHRSPGGVSVPKPSPIPDLDPQVASDSETNENPAES